MEIRKAGLADLESLVPLFDGYRQFYRKPSDIEAVRNFLHQRISREESVIYLAWNDINKAMGFVQLYPSFSSVSMKRLWVLNDLYVASAYRRQKVGQRLIEQARELAAQTSASALMLETEVSNEHAQQLYEKLGFEKSIDYYVYYLRI